jgi:N-acetylmuramoyl-L-alanine amidase
LRTAAAALFLAMTTRGAGAAESYVSLSSVAASYGLKVTTNSKAVVELRNQWTTLQFFPETRGMKINGTLMWLNDSVTSVDGRWCINTTDQAKVIDPILRPSRHLGGISASVVLLDPGHGGEDPGAIGRGGTREDRLTLDLAKRVRAKLVNAGIKTLLTRDSDHTLDLDARAPMIRRTGAQVFVSLHFNSTASRSIAGVETHVLAPRGYDITAGGDSATRKSATNNGNRFDAANTALGYQIQRSLRLWLGSSHDRGVRRSRFAVLRDATRPAVLVECGFLSHAQTEERLRSSAYMDSLAQRVADGIVEYVKAVRAARPAPKPPARK